MATRIVNAPRHLARRTRRVLLATALTSLLIAAPASALSFTIAPSLSSPAVAGQTANCLPNVVGILPPSPLISYRWGLLGQQVYGVTTNSIKLVPEAGGQWLFCEVTVTAPTLLQPVTSAFLAHVKGIPPANKSLPSVSGTAKVGSKVSCRHGNWTALPSSFSFKWLRNGSQVSTGRQRKLTSADGGQSLKCSVVAHNPYGSAGPVTSPAVTVH